MKERFHRVLVRVEAVIGGYAIIVVPSWNPDEFMGIKMEDFDELEDQVKAGSYLMAEVNIDAPEVKLLQFHNWEIAPEPEDETKEN